MSVRLGEDGRLRVEVSGVPIGLLEELCHALTLKYGFPGYGVERMGEKAWLVVEGINAPSREISALVAVARRECSLVEVRG